MFCTSCGKDLPDDANFCLRCGQPLRTTASAPLPAIHVVSPHWETCEIKDRLVQKPGWHTHAICIYYAEARGATGIYEVAQSPPYEAGRPDEQTSLDVLINQLMSEGWEYLGFYATMCWAKAFRRRVTPDRRQATGHLEHQAASLAAARNLLAYLRRNRVKVHLAAANDLHLRGAKLKPETEKKVVQLKPYLVELLRREGSP
jgi:hypothetical protein